MSEERKPTAKMKQMVKNMEKVLGVKCSGKAFDDVSKFISEHIDAYKEKRYSRVS